MAIKILLADDSLTIQKVVELTFSDGDTRLMAVGSGDKAVQALDDFQPDLVLADVVMPGLTGYDVCDAVKKRPGGEFVPVVLLTGTFEPFDRSRAERVGSDSIVTKPFDSHALQGLVRELVSKARAARADAEAAAAEAPPVPSAARPTVVLSVADLEETVGPPVAPIVDTARTQSFAALDYTAPPPPFGDAAEAAPQGESIYSTMAMKIPSAGELRLAAEQEGLVPPPLPPFEPEPAPAEPAEASAEEEIETSPVSRPGPELPFPPPPPPPAFFEPEPAVIPPPPPAFYEPEPVAAIPPPPPPAFFEPEPAVIPPPPPAFYEPEPAAAIPPPPPPPAFFEPEPAVIPPPPPAFYEPEPVAATPPPPPPPAFFEPEPAAAPPSLSPFYVPEPALSEDVAAAPDLAGAAPEWIPEAPAAAEPVAPPPAGEEAGVPFELEVDAGPETEPLPVEAPEPPAAGTSLPIVGEEPAAFAEPAAVESFVLEPEPEQASPVEAMEPEPEPVLAEAAPAVAEEPLEPFPEMDEPAPVVEDEASPWDEGPVVEIPPPPPELAAPPEEGVPEPITRDLEQDMAAFEASGRVVRRPEIWERHAALIGEEVPADIDLQQGVAADLPSGEEAEAAPTDLEEIAAAARLEDLSRLIPPASVSLPRPAELAAEPVAEAPPLPAAPAGFALSEADVDRIARRVVELLSEKAVRDIAWEVVPEYAERLVRERIAEVEKAG